jgi:hypothetical protein
MIVVTASQQAEGSKTLLANTPRGQHTKITVVVYSRTKHKVATPCSLTFPWSSLALTLIKHVLKVLDVITKLYGSLDIFFNVYELP